jgi:hypothetical protein
VLKSNLRTNAIAHFCPSARRVRVLLDMLGRRVPILVEGHHVGHAVLPTRGVP